MRMFKRIGYRIALQFTAFVFLLLVINGSLFLAADFNNARHQSQERLTRTMGTIVNRPQQSLQDLLLLMPPMMRDRARILDNEGKSIYEGAFFVGIPFSGKEGFSDWMIQNEQYRVLTASIMEQSGRAGYLQILDIERFQRGDLPLRALLYIIVSAGISAVTFLVGAFFARRSLLPAEAVMERLEQFTQDASHELRTPIAVLNSSLDLALRSGKHQEGIVSAKEDLRQISVLVERLLDLARLDTFTLLREKVDLTDLLTQSVEKQRLLADERGMTIDAEIAPDITVTGDPALLRQVIANLLSNAIKFNAERGRITVKLTKSTLTIEDTGIGISADHLPHIFDRFYQADESRARGGLGLGLALVKRIVDLHGWTIDAKSTVGKGTAFVIRFGALARGKAS
jgi:signal transduction histidine kinase